jgi:hypothetical protein
MRIKGETAQIAAKPFKAQEQHILNDSKMLWILDFETTIADSHHAMRGLFLMLACPPGLNSLLNREKDCTAAAWV